MDYVDLSDLEEGEILEYESATPEDSRYEDIKTKDDSSHSFKKEYQGSNFESERKCQRGFYQYEEGVINQNLKNKLKFSGKGGEIKSNMSLIDLESISSEEEHKSDEENKFSSGSKNYVAYSEGRNGKKKPSAKFYGTVEDIMSEIGETICRKSRCNYKRRKSKESHYSPLNKYSDKSYDMWSHKTFSSHLRSKRHKRNLSFSEFDSDSEKDKIEKQKKKKKRKEFHREEDKKSKKNVKVRDFDEMRRTLLEKLKMQKAEEETKVATKCQPEAEDSEIQEVDMLIDCTNYVDNPKDAMPENSSGEGIIEGKEREDEFDLNKLRLIALSSNKKQRSGKIALKTVKIEEDASPIKISFDNNKEEMDLERSELLLRAEALKTALLKKHQKRLNKLKIKKSNVIECTKDNDVGIPAVENRNSIPSERVSGYMDADAYKENVKRDYENRAAESYIHFSDPEVKIKELNETPVVLNGNLKKACPRSKIKRKRKKSGSFATNAKESTDKIEGFEEDDRTLRSQLLSDLMKKKSLKESERKPVLLSSTQVTATKPLLSGINGLSPKENEKPLSVARKTLVKKVNPLRTVKPVMAAKIPKAEIQRIIVNLGSVDSSDEDVTSCQPPRELTVGEDEEKKESKERDITKFAHPIKSIQADYEKSVELLLSQARKKIEGKKQITDERSFATPEAVYKHLPPSQRLEYIRLKQKIAERERQRKEKTESSGAYASFDSKTVEASTKETSKEKRTVEPFSQELKAKSENLAETLPRRVTPSLSSGLVFKSSISLSKTSSVSNSPFSYKTLDGITSLRGLKIKNSQHKVLNKPKNILEGVCNEELKPDFLIHRNRLLLPSSQALISKLKLLLKKIKIEKMIEENYDKEIVRLKNQLSLLEKKKSEQRFKIKKFGEESMKTYKAIQGITSKSKEEIVPKENEGRNEREGGNNDPKDEGKKPEKGVDSKIAPNEPEVELTQSKTDKSLKNEDEQANKTIARETACGICSLDYNSPLQVFKKVSDGSERVDPNVMMCHFDLTGVCKDEECTYQHLRAS